LEEVVFTRKIANVAIVATGFAGVVVMLGAWTRLVDAGLGCPDWPGCYGFLTVPNTADKIAIAEARFPHAPVEVHKGWPEMIHRYFASALGFMILCLTFYAWKVRKLAAQASEPRQLPIAHIFGLLVLVICQGLFGMWTVTLKLWPQVVSTHLLGGFATLSLLFLLFLRCKYVDPIEPIGVEEKRVPAYRKAAMLALILVVGQIFLGAWTASNYAALACGDELPTCHGEYWPDMDFSKGFDIGQDIGPNYLGGVLDDQSRTAIVVAHRYGAILLTLALIGLALMMRRLFAMHQVKAAVYTMLVVLAVQIALGLSNVIWLIPLHVAVAHNAVGALLLLTMVNLNFQLHRIKNKN
jgi:heme a synthase